MRRFPRCPRRCGEGVHFPEVAPQLAREEGILAGTSSGLNVAGALQVARELGPDHTVVTVAVDSGLKYLAGDLYAEGTSQDYYGVSANSL